MSAKFEDALEVSPLPDGRNWRVLEAFHYDTDIDHIGRIEVPAGFITDFASIPQLLWNILPPTGLYSKAAVIHDYLYRTPGLVKREDADAVLEEAMEVCGVGWIKRNAIWLGVRAAGGLFYKGGL